MRKDRIGTAAMDKITVLMVTAIAGVVAAGVGIMFVIGLEFDVASFTGAFTDAFPAMDQVNG